MTPNPTQPALFPDLDQRLLPGAAPVPLPVALPVSLPAQYGSPTSVAAARAKQSTAGSDRERIYSLIESRGQHGCTTDEIEAELNLPHQSASPRVIELAGRRRGYPVRIKPSGEKRKTRSGRNAEVFVAATA